MDIQFLYMNNTMCDKFLLNRAKIGTVKAYVRSFINIVIIDFLCLTHILIFHFKV